MTTAAAAARAAATATVLCAAAAWFGVGPRGAGAAPASFVVEKANLQVMEPASMAGSYDSAIGDFGGGAPQAAATTPPAGRRPRWWSGHLSHPCRLRSRSTRFQRLPFCLLLLAQPAVEFPEGFRRS
jgi:hypothetical protein